MVRLFIVCAFALTAACASTAPKPVVVDCADDPCGQKTSVCNEAKDFQREFDSMPPEEQKEMRAALNSYIDQCETLRQQCNNCRK